MKTFFISFILLIFLSAGFLVFWSNKNDIPVKYPASEVLMTLKRNPQAMQFASFRAKSSKMVEHGIVFEDSVGFHIYNLKSVYEAILEGDALEDQDSTQTKVDFSILNTSKEIKEVIKKAYAKIKNHTIGIEEMPMDKIEILAPLPEPRKLRTCILSKGHLRNLKRQELKSQKSIITYAGYYVPLNWILKDVIFSENNISSISYQYNDHLNLYGAKGEIPLNGSSNIDMEPQLALVISKNGKNIEPDEVKDYIAGYCLLNSITDRSFFINGEMNYYDLLNGKIANSMGPFIVTDLDPNKVAVEVFVNDNKVFTCSNEGLSKRIDEIISELSEKASGLFAGEVIGIGAMNGGSLFELDLPLLSPGDEIKIIGNQGLGVLENTLVDQQEE